MSSYELMNDSAGAVQRMLNFYGRVPNVQMPKSRTFRVTAFRSQRQSELFASNGAIQIPTTARRVLQLQRMTGIKL